jgi:hypothetical protein
MHLLALKIVGGLLATFVGIPVALGIVKQQYFEPHDIVSPATTSAADTPTHLPSATTKTSRHWHGTLKGHASGPLMELWWPKDHDRVGLVVCNMGSHRDAIELPPKEMPGGWTLMADKKGTWTCRAYLAKSNGIATTRDPASNVVRLKITSL